MGGINSGVLCCVCVLVVTCLSPNPSRQPPFLLTSDRVCHCRNQSWNRKKGETLNSQNRWSFSSSASRGALHRGGNLKVEKAHFAACTMGPENCKNKVILPLPSVPPPEALYEVFKLGVCQRPLALTLLQKYAIRMGGVS